MSCYKKYKNRANLSQTRFVPWRLVYSRIRVLCQCFSRNVSLNRITSRLGFSKMLKGFSDNVCKKNLVFGDKESSLILALTNFCTFWIFDLANKNKIRSPLNTFKNWRLVHTLGVFANAGSGLSYLKIKHYLFYLIELYSLCVKFIRKNKKRE